MNLQDPTQISLLTFVVSFVFYALVLYLIKPPWIQLIDRKGGKMVLSNQLLGSYAATFALVTAILALLLSSKHFSVAAPKPVNLMPYST